jgi:phosphopantetheine adenylyltransferase
MKRFLGYIANKIVQSTPRKKKVSPTIKSVKPNLTKTVKQTKSDEYVKRIRKLEDAQKKIKSGKEMIKEGQTARKKMIDTKRAFQFRTGSTHAIKPGDKPEVKYKGNVREQKMGGGMMGRRMGLKKGSFPDHSGDGKITKKDILMAKGVIPKPKGKKSGKRMKASVGGGADMGKVASDKTKTEVKKYEKRAKDASKFLKNKGRSFGSIMREKYMR